MTGAALRLPPQRERVRESSKSTTEPSNHSVVTFSCFHACLFAINFYKPLSRILTKLVLTVSVQFSMFLLEDESMEWPPPPYCSYHHFFFNVYLFIFGCAESSLLWGLFSSCAKRVLLSNGLLIAVASLVVAHKFWDARNSEIVACGLNCFSSPALEPRLSSCGLVDLWLVLVGSSQIRDRTRVSCIVRQILCH